jgi:hypothetical protein
MHAVAMRAFIALALTASGCSVIKTRSPQPWPQPPDCMTSRGPVLVDAIGSVFAGPVAAVLMYAFVDSDRTVTDGENVMIGVAFAAGFFGGIGSAVVGMVRTSRCRDATERLHYERPEQPPAMPAAPATPEPPAGTERGLCRPDHTCRPGLTCASNRCVVLPS